MKQNCFTGPIFRVTLLLMKDFTRKIKIQALAAGERKVGAIIELRHGKFYEVIRLDLDAGWAFLLLVASPPQKI